MAIHAQQLATQKQGELYFSWGYNTEWFTKSTVHVSQPEKGNVYDLVSVNARDHRGWDQGLLSEPISIPQYNYRVGYFFPNNSGWGIEGNFDHTKYLIVQGQNVHVKGTLGGTQKDTTVLFTQSNGFFYWLNNGANFLLINAVKRWRPISNSRGTIKIDAIAKAGIGPVIPHVQNMLFGEANNPHFQLGGWNVGVEGVIRATFYKFVYLEYSNKLDFASYSGLKIKSNGTISQSFGTYEMILSLGANIFTGKKNTSATN